MTSSTNNLFLHLLSAALWNTTADASLFKGLDANTWQGIVSMSRKQTVSALIADKALSLPTHSLPPTKLRLQFMVMIQQTEALNRKMIQVLSTLSAEYQAANFPFCLLKGLGVGVNYPKPLLRNAGDIDLFLYRKGDYEKSKLKLAEKGIEPEGVESIHYKYNKENIWIEIHQRISYFSNSKYDKLFRKWEKEIIDENNFESLYIDKVKVQTLPIEINGFFIFQHLFRHFLQIGVGFRQFCDWLLFLSKYKDQIDSHSFTSHAQSYALLYPMQVFARVAIKYLDAPEDIFPFPMIEDNKHVEMVLEDILHSGNFGFHRSGAEKPRKGLSRLWFSYKTTIQRSIKYDSLAQKHTRLLPVRKLINHFKNKL